MAQPATNNIPTLDQLKQALVIAEKIERLKIDLSKLIASAGVKRRGRPGKLSNDPDLAGFIAAANRAATVLARNHHEGPTRRGRKPGPGRKPVAATGGKARKPRVMSEEGRRRIIEAQKKRWAAVRKQKAAASR